MSGHVPRDQPFDVVRCRVEDLIGQRMVRFEPTSGGLTHAVTGLATLDDGTCVFVKAGVDDHARPQVATEIENLRQLRGSFLPQVVATAEDPPILVLEDLSSGHWPEPYPADVAGLEAALEELRSRSHPPGLDLQPINPPGEEILGRLAADARVAVAPAAAWVALHQGRIRDAVGGIRAGTALVHSDLWYSNICFLPDRVVLVDWSHLSTGSPWFDAATVSIDLVIEGRRPLEVEDGAGWAAAHIAWMTWALARGPSASISDPEAWVRDNLELFDGAAWWLSHELGVEPPPRLTERDVGW